MTLIGISTDYIHCSVYKFKTDDFLQLFFHGETCVRISKRLIKNANLKKQGVQMHSNVLRVQRF